MNKIEIRYIRAMRAFGVVDGGAYWDLRRGWIYMGRLERDCYVYAMRRFSVVDGDVYWDLRDWALA